MIELVVLYGAAAAVVLALLAVRLVRMPRNVPLWAVTGVVACLLIAFPFGVAADHRVSVFGLAPMFVRLLQHGVLLVGANLLVFFFVFSTMDARSAWRRTLWYVVPLPIALAAMMWAAFTAPAGAPADGRSTLAGAVLFSVADAYLAIGFAAAFVWSRRYARVVNARLARGLRIASWGMAAIVGADCLFIPSIVITQINPGHVSVAIASVLSFVGASLLLLPGTALFLLGVAYPAVAARWSAFRVWRRHLRAYRDLRPLWTALSTEFPENALTRAEISPWRDALTFSGVHRRYYRRVIECRDGLVLVSPYLTTEAADDAPLAGRLRDALARHAAGQEPPCQAMPVAVPPQRGLDADVAELVDLSRSLRPS